MIGIVIFVHTTIIVSSKWNRLSFPPGLIQPQLLYILAFQYFQIQTDCILSYVKLLFPEKNLLSTYYMPSRDAGYWIYSKITLCLPSQSGQSEGTKQTTLIHMNVYLVLSDKGKQWNAENEYCEDPI